MIDFTRNSFKTFYNIILWITLIAFIIGGLILGRSIGLVFIGKDAASLFSIIGGALGLLIGLIVIIISGGLVATFLKIDENINIIAIDIELIKEQNILLKDIKNILLENNKPKGKIIDIKI